MAIFADDAYDVAGATARHLPDSLCSGLAMEIRGAEPTAGISGTVGRVLR